MQSQNNQSCLTFESDPQVLLGVYKLIPSLPTFLTQALHSSSDADAKLFPNDWLAVAIERRLFLWKYRHPSSVRMIASNCREFELPGAEQEEEGSANLVSLSFGSNSVYQLLPREDLAPSLCVAASPRGMFRVWQRLHRQQEFSEVNVNIQGHHDEVAQSLEPGPCPGTFLLATNYGRIFAIDARIPQAKITTFLLLSSSGDAPAAGGDLKSNTNPDNSSSFLSGLSRRVSSVWSYASSRVTLPTLKFGKLVRFISHFPTDYEDDLGSSCLAFCLHQRQLTIWRVNAIFETVVVSVIELEHDLPGVIAVLAANSSNHRFNAIDLSPSGNTVHLLTSTAGHTPTTILTRLQFDGAEISSVSVETEDVSRLLMPSASASSVYPCQLAALHSHRQGLVDIIEVLTGKCVARVSFSDSSLVTVCNATAPSLFAFVTRQRGVYSLQASDRSLSVACCCPGELERCCASSPSVDLLELGVETASLDGVYEFLSRAAVIYWMSYHQEADRIIAGFFNHKAIQNLVIEQSNIVPSAFLQLARRVIDSRPANEPRWRAYNASAAGANQTDMGLNDTANSSMMTTHLSTTSCLKAANRHSGFDFARTGSISDTSTRFAAKQTGLQHLTAFYRLFHRSTNCIPESMCTTTLAQLSEILSSHNVSDDSEVEIEAMNDSNKVVGIESSTTHVLNAFLVAAEFTEFARSIQAKCTTKRDVCKPLQKIFRDVVGASGFPLETGHLLKSPEVFFQTISLVPNFVRTLAKQLEVQQAIEAEDQDDNMDFCSSDQEETLSFVRFAAQLLTTALSDMLTYREKFLPALTAAVFARQEELTGLDLPCWISTGAPFGVADSLLSIFDVLTTLGSGRSGRDSGDAACACQAVELASLLLRAAHQRVEWRLRSSSKSNFNNEDPFLEAWFARLRSQLISTVAMQMNRPESGLELAKRFSDKDHMVAICDQLDRQSDENAREIVALPDSSILMQSMVDRKVSRCHDHLMALLARAPAELKLTNFALQWHHDRGENARVQSLLTLLQQKDNSSGSLTTTPVASKQQDGTRPAEHSPIGQPPVKRIRPSDQLTFRRQTKKPEVPDPVDRFLSSGGRATSDLAWLHQLGSEDYQRASDGLLRAARNCQSNQVLGRKKTLLSLAKLSLLAGGCSSVSESEGSGDTIGVTKQLPSQRSSGKLDQKIDFIDKHLEVAKIQESLTSSILEPGGDQVPKTSDQRVLSISRLARLLVNKAHPAFGLFTGSLSSSSEPLLDGEPHRPGMLEFSRALRLSQLLVELEEETGTEGEQKDLLVHIWMQALRMDEWKKPTVDEDAVLIFSRSFFGRLFDQCLTNTDTDQLSSIFPNLSDLLGSLSHTEQPDWLPLLVETGVNHILAV